MFTRDIHRMSFKSALAAALLVSVPVVADARPVVPAAAPGVSLVSSALKDGPSAPALTAALAAYESARAKGEVALTNLLTVIDYTRPSTEPRMWVLDLVTRRVLFKELVAHGSGSGDNVARAFSNDADSHMTSLGLFVTADSYMGKNGYSLRLRGLDPGLNDHALARAIVIHGAAYVSDSISAKLGRLGRSWGCPAVRLSVAKTLIDTIKGGTAVFAYGSALPSQTSQR